jgi:DNA helicase-2/ATP-dependent DNA helicase PcrA
LTTLRERYHAILVDEYQDTNENQYLLVRQLSERTRNLTVVGDDDQSIYAWRGADIRNILEFERDYADAKVVRLERNYRSTKRILQAAAGLIRNNQARKEKALWTDNDDGERVGLLRAEDEEEGKEPGAAMPRRLEPATESE